MLSISFTLPFSPITHSLSCSFTRPLFLRVRILFSWRDFLNIVTMYLYWMRINGIFVEIFQWILCEKKSNRSTFLSIDTVPAVHLTANSIFFERRRKKHIYLWFLLIFWRFFSIYKYTTYAYRWRGVCFFVLAKWEKNIIRFVSYINYRLMQMRRQFHFNDEMNEQEKKIERK